MLKNSKGSEYNLPETIIFRDEELVFTVPILPLAQKDGGVKIGESKLNPRMFSLRGRIYFPGDKEKIRQERDKLLKFLSHPPIQVYKNNRYLIGYPQGIPQSWIDLGREFAIEIIFISPDPYWYGESVEKIITGTETIAVDGTAKTYPVIETTNKVVDVKVINGDYEVEVTNGGSAKIIIDNKNMTVTADGVSCLHRTKEKWRLGSFALLPGDNKIVTTKQIKLTYQPRWY